MIFIISKFQKEVKVKKPGFFFYALCFINLLLLVNCHKADKLYSVSVKEFSKFVSETGYVTDAEKYGWSIVQETVYSYKVVNGATWQIPNGIDSTKTNMPITQVSYNDAIAYCNWANAKLPSYQEYWSLTNFDKKKIIKNDDHIYETSEVHIIGNVWDITTTEKGNGDIRLAGGSFLCNVNTCDGTNPDRVLYVDKTTGNINIGFSVIK